MHIMDIDVHMRLHSSITRLNYLGGDFIFHIYLSEDAIYLRKWTVIGKVHVF